jgi:hypothetical protein
VYIKFGTQLPKEAIVHTWNCRQCVAGATRDGYVRCLDLWTHKFYPLESPNADHSVLSVRYNVINSQGWYLDHLTDNWQAMYTNDPVKGIDSTEQQKLVLGGQGEMW